MRGEMMEKLALTTVFVSFLLSMLLVSPVHAELSQLQPGEGRVILTVENMTWAACVVAVRNSLRKLEGVKYVEVDYDAGEAIVIYYRAVVSTRAMIKATTKIGFPSKVKSYATVKRER